MRVAAGGEQQNKVILSGCFPLGGFGGDFHPRMPNKFLMMVGRELFLYMEGLPAKCFASQVFKSLQISECPDSDYGCVSRSPVYEPSSTWRLVELASSEGGSFRGGAAAGGGWGLRDEE